MIIHIMYNSPFSESNRHVLVEAGAISVFVQLLESSDEDIQFYSAAALSNLAVHGEWGHAGVRHQVVTDCLVLGFRVVQEGYSDVKWRKSIAQSLDTHATRKRKGVMWVSLAIQLPPPTHSEKV